MKTDPETIGGRAGMPADESLAQLTHLVASLLDMTRLRAGALPVYPRSAGLAVSQRDSRSGTHSTAVTLPRQE